MGWRRAILGVGALLIAGCTSTGGSGASRSDDSVTDSSVVAPPGTDPPSADPPSADPPTTTPSDQSRTAPDVVDLPAAPDGGPFVDGRANELILVLDEDAGAESLTLHRVDGSRAAVLSRSDGEVVSQPAWAPDGRSVAWARSEDGSVWELAVAAADGSRDFAVELPGRPDYLTFDPTGSRVTALTPSPVGFGLVVVDLDESGQEQVRVADVGQPYFTDFAPDGERVVAHVGREIRLVQIGATDADPEPLASPSTSHQTPQWHPAEDIVLYSTDRASGGGELVRRDLADDDEVVVGEFDAFAFFDLDPSGGRVAVSSFTGQAGSDTPRALRQDPVSIPPGLSIVDLAGGPARRLSDQPASAPLWDPTGSRVLVRDSLADAGRWVVHGVSDDGAQTAATDEFTVADSQMPLYLRFWDQYVRSQTVWSPDGDHFVHVGASADGRSGVWVHEAGSSGPSAYLTDGDLALWSPT